MVRNVIRGRERSFQLLSLTNLARSLSCFYTVVRKGFGSGVCLRAQPTGSLSRVLQAAALFQMRVGSSLEEDWNETQGKDLLLLN